jgi:hypothetical protein
MSHNYQDPKAYLNNAVTKRGKSGAEGVYLSNVTVVADCSIDYGYRANASGTSLYNPPFPFDYEDWLSVLVAMRGNPYDVPTHLITEDATFQFIPEGGNIYLNVFIPLLNADVFEIYVSECQGMLQFVGDFAGKIPTFIRFSIGYAFRKWDRLAEEGEVQASEYPEQDLSY